MNFGKRRSKPAEKTVLWEKLWNMVNQCGIIYSISMRGYVTGKGAINHVRNIISNTTY